MSPGAEQPSRDLEAVEKEIRELEQLSQEPATQERLRHLHAMVEQMRAQQDSGPPAAWLSVQMARHPQRPYFLDFAGLVFQEFSETARRSQFRRRPGHRLRHGPLPRAARGRPRTAERRTTKDKLRRNFGMSKPEGYRKALRVMQFAAKFGRPILTFLDTPGAYPAWTPRRADRPRPSPATCGRWLACRCLSW